MILRDIEDYDLEALIKYANNKSIARYMKDRFPHP